MSIYEIVENVLSEDTEKRTLRVQISDDETIYLSFDINPSQERVDAEVEVYLANQALVAAQQRLDDAKNTLRDVS